MYLCAASLAGLLWGGAWPGDDIASAFQALVKSAKDREVWLRQHEVQYCSVLTAQSGELLSVEYVTIVFSGEREKWVRRSADFEEGSAATRCDPREWVDQARALPVSEIDIWDGGRHLSISKSARGEWSGSLLRQYKTFCRRGPMRASLMPGEKWLSERLERLAPVAMRISGNCSCEWILQASNEKRTDVHRIVTDPCHAQFVADYRIYSFARADLTNDGYKDSPFEFLDARSPLIHDTAAIDSYTDGGVRSITVRLTQTYADSVDSAIIVIEDAKATEEAVLSSRQVPAEAGVRSIQLFDELLQETIVIGEAMSIGETQLSEVPLEGSTVIEGDGQGIGRYLTPSIVVAIIVALFFGLIMRRKGAR